jgi:hypothetical protein
MMQFWKISPDGEIVPPAWAVCSARQDRRRRYRPPLAVVRARAAARALRRAENLGASARELGPEQTEHPEA